jgi:hypothetical protein
MDKDNTLELVKQALHGLLPYNDGRARIQLQDFLTALIFCFTGDSKTLSIDAMRRTMMDHLKTNIPRSTFWERLATKSLTKNLQNILSYFMGTVELPFLKGQVLLKALNVSSIRIIDSSSVALWDGLKGTLPGTRTTAGIKWHSCFDLLTGMLTWFDLSSTSDHDRKYFPNVEDLRGVLMIFDLGYFDYGLMNLIEQAGGFFLCRVKSNSKIRVLSPIEGVDIEDIGKLFRSIRFSANIIDFIGINTCQKHGTFERRVVGFYNPQEKMYHWYLTNMLIGASLIYPIYRLRWQCEMIFKACKSSLNIDAIPTNNPNIVMNLMLTSILSYLFSLLIVEAVKEELTESEAEAITPQRVAKALVHVSSEFFGYLISKTSQGYDRLKSKISLYAREIFDPNFRHRPTTLQRALSLC